MSDLFAGFGGFGQASTPAFSAASAPAAFNAASAPAFQSPFNAQPSAGGVFGQTQQTNAFGAAPSTFGAPQPAFGAPQQSASAFSTGFSAPSAAPVGGGGFGFGGAAASSPSLFGSTSTPTGFGAAPPTTFGAAAPSAQPFAATGSTFNASGGFGTAASTPGVGFGQTLSAFGSSAFGATPGAAGGGFSTPSFTATAQRGSRSVAWRKTQETDTSGTSGAKTTIYYNCISCMPEYASKSPEELRWEDYQDGCKGGGGATPGTGSTGLFGSPSPAAASPSPFGTSPSPFGAPAQSQPAFGGFGATTSPSFAAPQTSAGFGFNASSASPFGGISTPSFGQASTPAFGAVSSTPGGFNQPATSQPTSFGFGGQQQQQPQQTASGFGAPQSAAAFTGFGASSASLFGGMSAPASFPAASSSAFSFGGASAGGFASSAPSLFGAQSSASLFSAASTPSLFGAKPATTGGFSFPSPTSAPAFPSTASPAMPNFGSTPGAMGGGLFGTPNASTPAFSFAPSQPATSSFALVPAGQQQQMMQQQGQATASPAVGGSPYGVLPTPPVVSALPEYRVGLTQQQKHPLAPASGGPPRPVALITPRSLTPRSGHTLRARQGTGSLSRLSRSGAAELLASNAGAPGSASGGPMSGNGVAVNGVANGGIASPSLFVARNDPRRLFVREPLPSTEGAMGVSPSPYKGPGGGFTPARTAFKTPGAGLRPTPSYATAQRESEQQNQHLHQQERVASPQDVYRHQQRDDGGVGLSEGEVAELLPRVTRAEYYTEPSVSQLTAMARDNPDNLACVSNFTVGRRGVGSVRWLDPTDIRALDLDSIITLNRGSIEVYLDDATKPEVGYGLNKPAEVTMLKVFKVDKESGQPTTDPESIERFTRKLKRVTAGQGARFVSYDSGSGTWRFEVEHFSKYGLVDDSEDDDDDNNGNGDGNGNGNGNTESDYVIVDDDRPQKGRKKRVGSRGARDNNNKNNNNDDEAMVDGGSNGSGELTAAGFGDDNSGSDISEDDDGLQLGLASKFGKGSAGRGLDGGRQKRGGQERDDDDDITATIQQQQGLQGGGGKRQGLTAGQRPRDDAGELQRIREGLFGVSTRQPASKQRRIILTGDPRQHHLSLTSSSAAQAALEGTAREQQLSTLTATGTATTKALPSTTTQPIPVTSWRKQRPHRGGLTTSSPKKSSLKPSTTTTTTTLPPSSSMLVPSPSPQHLQQQGTSMKRIDTAEMLDTYDSTTTTTTTVLPIDITEQGVVVCPVPAPQNAPSVAVEQSLPDSGMFLGRSFKVGWAPNGMCIIPGGATLAYREDSVPEEGLTAATMTVHKIVAGGNIVDVENDDNDDDNDGGVVVSSEEYMFESQRRLECQLQLHLELSSPDGRDVSGIRPEEKNDGDDSAATKLPRWRLRCDKLSGLRDVTLRHMQLCNEAAKQSKSAIDRSVLRRQAAAWELVYDLFGLLPSEAAQLEAGNMQTDNNDDDDDGDMPDLHRLVSFERRAQVSRWLADRARYKAEQSASQDAPSNSEEGVAIRILALLSAHQLTAAAAVAAAAGDVRLSTMLITAGKGSEARALLSSQIEIWKKAGILDHVDPAMRAVYDVLAGDVDSVVGKLDVDWRGALGMHLWYGADPTDDDGIHPPTANNTLASVLQSYSAAVQSGTAPPPSPGYIEEGHIANNMEDSDNDDNDDDEKATTRNGHQSAKVADVAFELLKLSSYVSSSTGMGDDDEDLLGRLVRSTNVTPDPMDASFSFFLLVTLMAVDAIDADSSHPAVLGGVGAMLEMLECYEGMAHWAVFVALHLPDIAVDDSGSNTSVVVVPTREAVIRRLLAVHCPEWRDNPQVQSFFLEKLKLPASWLAAAKAQLAAAEGGEEENTERLFHEAVAAKEWNLSHAVLCRTLAPQWLLASTSVVAEKLIPALTSLAQHAHLINGWQRGGAVYIAFLQLWGAYGAPLSIQSLDSTTNTGNTTSSNSIVEMLSRDREQRLSASQHLADALREFATRPPLDALPTSPGSVDCGLSLRRAVLAFMAQKVSRWLAGDARGGGEMMPSGGRVAVAAGVRGLSLSGVASAVAVGSVSLAAGAT